MGNESIRWLKSKLKGKISITKGVIIAFMITGSIFTYAVDEQPEKPTLSPIDITINNYGEQTGLELGDNSRARGVGSVSTGRNGMAIGKNAVATGKDETKETIEKKLEENRQKLQEIADAKKVITDKAEELRLKQIRERETIEAGIRVEEIQKSKEKARLAWEDKKQELATKTEESKEFFRIYQEKIDILNSKLRGLANLEGASYDTEGGLSRTADLLKAKVEEGNELNLSHDFYLDYVKTYYKTLGDLRENKVKYEDLNTYSPKPEHIGKLKKYGLLKDIPDDLIIDSSSDAYLANDSISSYADGSGSSSSSVYNKYYKIGSYRLYTNEMNKRTYLTTSNGRGDNNEADSYDSYVVNGKRIKTYLNTDIDLTTEQEYNDWNSVKEIWKTKRKEYNKRLGDEILGKLHDSTNGISTTLYDMVTDMKFEMVDLDKQITYYQWKYDQNKNDKTWLDKKAEAIAKKNEKIINNVNDLKAKARELGINLTDISELNDKLAELAFKNKYGVEGIASSSYYNLITKWKKENIDDVEVKNKLTTDKLTSELEKALGINKNAIIEKQGELAKLGEQVDQAKRNYEGLNPTESDMILAKEYQRVKEEINRLTTDLKNAETRKDNLEKALTLHDLKNIGENQIAFGTDTLAVGDNAIAMGYKSITVGTDSVNIGTRGQATGTSITQLGQDLITNGNDNISIGKNNIINGENNIVFGRNNNIGALGDTNKSNGNIVLGSGITVSKDITNSITLGDSSTPVSNSISVGSKDAERQIKNVKDATDNQDAVTYKQLKDYVAQNGGSGNSNLDTKDLEERLNNKLDKEISKYNVMSSSGVANAIATASLPQVSNNYTFAISAAGGHYNGQNALAVGISGQSNDGRFVYKIGSALNTKSKFSIGVGATVSFGEIVTPSDVNAKENKEIRERNSALEYKVEKMEQNMKDLLNKIQELTNKIEILDSKSKK